LAFKIGFWGYFAEACMEGLIEGRRLGAVNIKKVVFQEF